ncbi:MAG TPA: ABC transporter permease [Gemmataceae bacterium]|nr:ABC transporter permease [Gemmataceae bacterium]
MHILDPELWSIVWLSLCVSGTSLIVSAVVGIPLGAWLGQAQFFGKRWISALIHTGMALPPVLVGLLVYLLLSHSGPLAELGWLFTPQAMILAQTILALPWVIGITMAAVAAVPADLLAQVRSLGASPWQLRWTLIREARQGVVLAVAAAFARNISEVGAVLIVGGNIQGHTRVLTTAIVLETAKGQFALALALGAWLLFLALLANLVIIRAQGRPWV